MVMKLLCVEEVVVHVQSADRIVVHLRSGIRISLPWNVRLPSRPGKEKGF
jgi:hypothetical protein